MSTRVHTYTCLLMVVGNLCPVLAYASTPSARELLVVSDRARGGIAQGVSWGVDVQAKEDGDDNQRSFLVRARGNDALVEATAPSRTKGEVYLFNDRNMWFFSPRISKPLSISTRQRLSGQAANGDIASTNYARDYKAEIAGEEILNGEKVYKLQLKAVSKQATYDQIRYYISVEKKLGVKAEFLTLQGDLLKSAVFEYGNQINIDGKIYPFVSRMTISNPSFPEDRTTIVYQTPKIQAQPVSIFNVNNLRVH